VVEETFVSASSTNCSAAIDRTAHDDHPEPAATCADRRETAWRQSKDHNAGENSPSWGIPTRVADGRWPWSSRDSAVLAVGMGLAN